MKNTNSTLEINFYLFLSLSLDKEILSCHFLNSGRGGRLDTFFPPHIVEKISPHDAPRTRKQKVPTGSIANHNEKYFWFHHSNGDTMDVMDPLAMDLCSALWTVYAYVLADMDEILPRG